MTMFSKESEEKMNPEKQILKEIGKVYKLGDLVVWKQTYFSTPNSKKDKCFELKMPIKMQTLGKHKIKAMAIKLIT